MRGKRPILQPLRSKEPALAVRLHDERVAAGDGIYACRAGRWHIIRCFSHRKIRHIHAGPFLLRFVPPDILLALRPWPALWISRRTVIQDTPVGGPGVTPLQECVAFRVAR